MTQDTGSRPRIETVQSGMELRRWYWLKSELAAEARRRGVASSGAKFTLLERLCHVIDTGDVHWPGDQITKNASRFDWHASALSLDTVITDNYKNTQNVRRFFKNHADPAFKFNIEFMDWIKANVGKTLGDASQFWLTQRAAPAQTHIKPHNQFNQYVRDFTQDNPTLGMAEARKAWATKRAQPSATGRHHYDQSDVAALDEKKGS